VTRGEVGLLEEPEPLEAGAPELGVVDVDVDVPDAEPPPELVADPDPCPP
jgi:hypothetical protein